MPMPKPRKGEKQNQFISRCISQLKGEDTEKPNDQIQAICFDTWRRSKKKKLSSEKKEVHLV